MMLLSRKLVVAFVCVFILGALAGAVLAMNITDLRFSNFLNRTNDPSSLALRVDQKLLSDYHLNPDQQERIAPLTRAMAQNLYQLRRKFAADVLATLDRSHEAISQQMTPEQRDAYKKVNDDRRKRAAGMLMPEAAPSQAASTH